MTTFLLCWYALGWVAEGINFVLLSNKWVGRSPFWVMSIILGPVAIILYFLVWGVCLTSENRFKGSVDEYFWRNNHELR